MLVETRKAADSKDRRKEGTSVLERTLEAVREAKNDERGPNHCCKPEGYLKECVPHLNIQKHFN